MVDAMCRGSWVLGSACGECSRCRESALDGALELQRLIRNLRAEQLRPDEADALWRYHHESEHECANKAEYDDAKYHNERAKVFWRAPKTAAQKELGR